LIKVSWMTVAKCRKLRKNDGKLQQGSDGKLRRPLEVHLSSEESESYGPIQSLDPLTSSLLQLQSAPNELFFRVGRYCEPLILGVLSLPKALDIMRGYSVLFESEERALEELCNELQQLTFAIRIASSILERGVLPSELLMRLRRRGARAYDNLAKEEDLFGRNPSLPTLFDESFEALERDSRPASSLAIKLAAVRAWFAPIAVPGPLLVAAAAAISKDLNSEQEIFVEAVSMLVEYSLASRSVTDGQVSFHRLLQLYGQERFGVSACKAMVFAVQEVGSVAEHLEHFNQACLWAFSEPEALVLFAEGEEFNQFINKVCFELAHRHALHTGNLRDAHFLLAHCFKGLERGTPLWWRGVCIKGVVLQVQGHSAEAEMLQRQALEGRESTLGPKHPETLRSLDNLASVLRDRARYDEAEELQRRTLEGRNVVLGLTHPHTLGSMQTLASILFLRGQHAEGEALLRPVVEIMKVELGAEHSDTIGGMCELSLILTRRGCAAEAEELLRCVVEGREALAGPMHFQTLKAVDDLAYTVRMQGRNDEAELLNRRALLGLEATLGPTHPQTLASLNNLGVSVLNLGRHGEAELLFRRAFEIKKDMLGDDHPSTLNSANNVAIALVQQGRYLEA
jgi:tetratricopeptide (TPR) repeat protein